MGFYQGNLGETPALSRPLTMQTWDLIPGVHSPLPLGISQINHSGDDKNTFLDRSGLGTAFLCGFGCHLCF